MDIHLLPNSCCYTMYNQQNNIHEIFNVVLKHPYHYIIQKNFSHESVCSTYFMPLVFFYTLWKHQKPRSFLMFWGGAERDQQFKISWTKHVQQFAIFHDFPFNSKLLYREIFHEILWINTITMISWFTRIWFSKLCENVLSIYSSETCKFSYKYMIHIQRSFKLKISVE